MKKYQVTGTLSCRFDIEVDAQDEESAEQQVRQMEYLNIIEKSAMPEIEVDSVLSVRARKSA